MTKYIRVEMPDGSKWDVPASLIETDYTNHYDDLAPEREIPNSDLIDWAANNMNWDDVKASAVQVVASKETDYDDGWANGEKEIVEKY